MLSIFRKKEKQKVDPELVLRGRHAAELLKSDLFHECMESLEKDIWQQFLDTAANEHDAREVLYVHVTALKNIKDRLELYAQQGKLAEAQIKQKEKRK